MSGYINPLDNLMPFDPVEIKIVQSGFIDTFAVYHFITDLRNKKKPDCFGSRIYYEKNTEELKDLENQVKLCKICPHFKICGDDNK